MLTSIAPATVFGLPWVFWFYIVKTPLWQDEGVTEGTETELSAGESGSLGYYECFVDAKETAIDPSMAFALHTLQSTNRSS